MRRFSYTAAVTLLFAAGAPAQDDMGGYNFMEIVQIGELIGGFSGGFEQMTGGVEIVLRADDPELEPLPIKARTMRFEYQGDTLDPSQILMEGGVNVDHPTANVQADSAVWNFDSGEMTFSGNVIMNNDRMKNVRATQLILDFNDNTFRMSNVQADQVSLPSEENKTVPGMLTGGDITDTTGLVEAFKAEVAAGGNSPGARMNSMLDAEAQRLLREAPTSMIVERQSDFIAQLNRVLRAPDLYSEAAWSGKTLSQEAQTLLAKTDRSDAETVRLNRWLLHAAYPNHIAAP